MNNDMSVKVIIPTALRQHTNNEDELQLNSRDVKGALQELVTSFPGLKRYLYSDNGRLRNFINIYLNEEDIRYISGEDTPLKDGEEQSPAFVASDRQYPACACLHRCRVERSPTTPCRHPHPASPRSISMRRRT